MNLRRHLVGIAALVSFSVFAQNFSWVKEYQCQSFSPLEADTSVSNYFDSLYETLPLNDPVVQAMSKAVARQNFHDPIFFQKEKSFDAAIRLYQNGMNTYRFLDLYDVIQLQHMVRGIYEAESGMTGARIEFKHFTSEEDPVLLKYAQASPNNAYLQDNKGAFLSHLALMEPLFDYIAIKLPEPVATPLQSMGLKNCEQSDPDEEDEEDEEDEVDIELEIKFRPNQQGPEIFAIYLKRVIEEGVNIILVNSCESPTTVYLPSWVLFNTAQTYWSSTYNLDERIAEGWSSPRALPALGLMTRLDVRVQRGHNMHPTQLYHPATTNLLFPHALYAGTMAGRHDMYHLVVLGFWPVRDKKIMHYMHDSLDHLHRTMLNASKQSRPVLDDLEAEFKTGLHKLINEWLPGTPLTTVYKDHLQQPLFTRSRWDFSRLDQVLNMVLDQNDDNYTKINNQSQRKMNFLDQMNAFLNIDQGINLEELVELNYYLFKTIRQFRPTHVNDTISDISPLVNSIELFQKACNTLFDIPLPGDVGKLFPEGYYAQQGVDTDTLLTHFAAQELLRQLYRFWEHHLNSI